MKSLSFDLKPLQAGCIERMCKFHLASYRAPNVEERMLAHLLTSSISGVYSVHITSRRECCVALSIKKREYHSAINSLLKVGIITRLEVDQFARSNFVKYKLNSGLIKIYNKYLEIVK